MGRFFDTPVDKDGHPILTYNRPRPIVGAAQRLNLSKFGEKLDKRAPQEWQIAAWRFFENIGEIHYAFNLIGQVCSRVRLFAAVVAAPNEVPTHVDTWLESLGDKGNTDRSRSVVDKAKELLDDLTENTPGRTSGMMRTLAMNFGIPGEVYLVQDSEHHEWLVLSSEELTSQTNKWRVRRSRQGRTTSGGTVKDLVLPGDAWAARMWRTHPRWGDEPDSSMLGVLDQCEQLVLLDQAMRNMARRAMNAGVVFIPQGITAFSDNPDETVADALAQSALQAVESEAALSTVTPKVLTGPLRVGRRHQVHPAHPAHRPQPRRRRPEAARAHPARRRHPQGRGQRLGGREVRQRHRHRRRPVPSPHRAPDPAHRGHVDRRLPATPVDEGTQRSGRQDR